MATSAHSMSDLIDDVTPVSNQSARLFVIDTPAAVSADEPLNDTYLTDERWKRIAPLLPGKDGAPGRHGRDNRLFVEAVFWMVRTNATWRSLPPQFGKWYTIYTRFRRWMQHGVWADVLKALAADGPCEYFYDEGAIRYQPVQPRAGENI